MRTLRVVVVFVVLLAVSTAAFGWGAGTHAYMAAKMKGVQNANQWDLMYGAVAPDINQVLSTDQESPFFLATHYGFMDVWAAAQTGTLEERTLAFGYVTHNELWGADRFAHIQSHIYPNFKNPYQDAYPGQNGYVWKKSTQLCGLLSSQTGGDPLAAVMLQGAKGLMNCHFIVEYGMDLVLKWTRDPQIGAKLAEAAIKHDTVGMENLLTSGYPTLAPYFTMSIPELGGATAPQAWAANIALYGTALNQPMGLGSGQDVDAVSDYLVGLAAQLMAEDLANAGVDASALKPLIKAGLIDSMILCARDFPLELTATIGELKGKLASHKVRY